MTEWPDCPEPGCKHKVCLWGVKGLCYPHELEIVGKEAMDKRYEETHEGKKFQEDELDRPQVALPPFCDRHQYEIVHEAKYKKTDPWRALIVIAQVAMFQGMTVTPSVHKRLEGDISKIGTLGCFACRLPHKWAQVIKAAKVDLKDIKELGLGWVSEANNKAD